MRRKMGTRIKVKHRHIYARVKGKSYVVSIPVEVAEWLLENGHKIVNVIIEVPDENESGDNK